MGREDLGNEGSIIVFGAVNKESCQKNICRSPNIIFKEKFRKYGMPRFLRKYL